MTLALGAGAVAGAPAWAATVDRWIVLAAGSEGLPGAPEALAALRAGLRAALPDAEILTPEDVAARARAADEASDAPARARTLLDEARGHRLKLESALAVASCREALSVAGTTLLFFHDRAALAQMQLALAAAEIEADRLVAARATLHEALRTDPALRVDPGRFSPDLVALHAEILRVGAEPPRPPTTAELARLGAAIGATAIVVATVELLGERPTLRAALFEPARGDFARVVSELFDPSSGLPSRPSSGLPSGPSSGPSSPADAAVAPSARPAGSGVAPSPAAAGAAVARALALGPTAAPSPVSVPAAASTHAPSGPGAPAASLAPGVTPRPPLWRRPLFWTGVGAGAALVAVATGVTVSLLRPAAVDVILEHPGQ